MWKKLALLISILLVLCLTSGAWAKVLGHWKLDEGSGTTAKDSSSNANNGKLTGGPQWVTGKLGKALSFDGKTILADGKQHQCKMPRLAGPH